MRTEERLRKLRDWCYTNLCEGREMKTQAPDGDMKVILRTEPKVYIAYFPMRPDLSGPVPTEALSTAPSILIMPSGGYVKNQEEQRFDRYTNVHRPKEMGQSMSVQVLFSVYQDGLRLPGFLDKAEQGVFDPSLIEEGTEDGVFTLTNWMDEFNEKLLSEKFVPGTDMFVIEASMSYGLYDDQKFVADRRPLFHGLCNVTFQCHADEYNPEINELLR